MRISAESKKEKTTRRRDLTAGGERHAWRTAGSHENGNGNGQNTAVRERKCFAIEDIDTLVVS